MTFRLLLIHFRNNIMIMKNEYLRVGFLWMLGTVLCIPSAYCQEKNDQVVKYANTINAEDAKAHLSFLADDMLEGRKTGERGQKLAARYIKSQFSRVGLHPGANDQSSYFQTYQLNSINLKNTQLLVGKKTFSYLTDFFFLGNDIPSEIDPNLQFTGFGLSEEGYNNLEGISLENKIAVFFARRPKEDDRPLPAKFEEWGKRMEQMIDKGAKGFVLIATDDDVNIISRYVSTEIVFTDKPGGSANDPYLLIISEEVAQALFKANKLKFQSVLEGLKSSGSVEDISLQKSSIELTNSIERKKVEAENVLGYLEGTDKKEELLVLTAHYDHIGINRNGDINNGADDDGSGTTAILELAEAFAIAAEQGHRPRRSILFMTVSGEEIGLLGSEYYADHPVYPLENTVANLNIDMIGRVGDEYKNKSDSTNYIYLIGSDMLSTELHDISEEVNEIYTQLTLDYKYNDENDPNRFYYRSDHYNFAKNNIPIIFYFNGTHRDYHKPTDTVEKINFEKLAKVARLVFVTAWEIANRDEKLVVDKAN